MQTYKQHLTLFLIVTTILVVCLTTLVVTLVYLYQKKQLIYQQKIDNLKLDYDKNLLQTQIEIQENTFQKISREIHDNISLTLTLAKLNLNTLNWSRFNIVKEKVEHALQQVSNAITDLSDISKSLNSELICKEGLLKALEKELEKISEMTFFKLELRVTGDPVFMDSNKELVIFRIIQEALNNIIKHAKATQVELGLNFTGSEVDILIQDNGKGFLKDHIDEHVRKNSGAGLNNIQKRAAIFNGKATIESEIGKGTKVFVSIPY
jgi:two-component system, NarL family, sensor kinase